MSVIKGSIRFGDILVTTTMIKNQFKVLIALATFLLVESVIFIRN